MCSWCIYIMLYFDGLKSIKTIKTQHQIYCLFLFLLCLKINRHALLTYSVTLNRLAPGITNAVEYEWPRTTQVMLRNRMPCRHSNVLADLFVFRSLLPFVYQEKTSRIFLRHSCYQVGNNTHILMKLLHIRNKSSLNSRQRRTQVT